MGKLSVRKCPRKRSFFITHENPLHPKTSTFSPMSAKSDVGGREVCGHVRKEFFMPFIETIQGEVSRIMMKQVSINTTSTAILII